jgi:hypothetical protein
VTLSQVILSMKSLVRKDVVRHRVSQRLEALRVRAAAGAARGLSMREMVEEDHRLAQAAGPRTAAPSQAAAGDDSGTSTADTWLLPGLRIGPPPVLHRMSVLVEASDGAGASASLSSVDVEMPRGFLSASR